VTHAELIRPKKEVDLKSDPPPDLVIEVEITSSAILKMKLFAKMGVPEVWRRNGEQLEMYCLKNGEYLAIDSSTEHPGLTISLIDHWLNKRFDIGETKLIREFRKSLI
jgi:Uma2 family endonuclease